MSRHGGDCPHYTLHPHTPSHTMPPPHPTAMAKSFGWSCLLDSSILTDILRMCYEMRREVLRAARSPPAGSHTSSAGARKLDEATIGLLKRSKSDIDDLTRTASSPTSSSGTCRQRQSSALDPRGGCAPDVLTTADLTHCYRECRPCLSCRSEDISQG